MAHARTRKTLTHSLVDGLSGAWGPFEKRLATTLGALADGQYLVLSVKRSDHYVQFAGQGSFGIRAETTSNNYLPQAEQLHDEQIRALVSAGWNEPTGTPTGSTPRRDPDGSPNFFVDFAAPVPFDAIANLTVRTFAEILRVPHPAYLEYQAYDDQGDIVARPELGLNPHQRSDPAADLEQTKQQLLETLAEATGLADLAYDADGEVAIHFNGLAAYVGLETDPPCVRIWSPVLSDVEASGAVLGHLNDLNATERLLRFVLRNGTVFAVCDTPVEPFVSSHVSRVFDHFCAEVDSLVGRLQEELGGDMELLEVVPPPTQH